MKILRLYRICSVFGKFVTGTRLGASKFQATSTKFQKFLALEDEVVRLEPCGFELANRINGPLNPPNTFLFPDQAHDIEQMRPFHVSYDYQA